MLNLSYHTPSPARMDLLLQGQSLICTSIQMNRNYADRISTDTFGSTFGIELQSIVSTCPFGMMLHVKSGALDIEMDLYRPVTGLFLQAREHVDGNNIGGHPKFQFFMNQCCLMAQPGNNVLPGFCSSWPAPKKLHGACVQMCAVWMGQLLWLKRFGGSRIWSTATNWSFWWISWILSSDRLEHPKHALCFQAPAGSLPLGSGDPESWAQKDPKGALFHPGTWGLHEGWWALHWGLVRKNRRWPELHSTRLLQDPKGSKMPSGYSFCKSATCNNPTMNSHAGEYHTLGCDVLGSCAKPLVSIRNPSSFKHVERSIRNLYNLFINDANDQCIQRMWESSKVTLFNPKALPCRRSLPRDEFGCVWITVLLCLFWLCDVNSRLCKSLQTVAAVESRLM